jgi:uncharacterized membrane-anchored protein YhcB (DUF1043 family)
MMEKYFVFWIIQAFILLLGVAVGHSFILFRLRREENRKRELELTLLERRTDVLRQGRRVAQDLEEALYRAKVQQEIDDIIRKDRI